MNYRTNAEGLPKIPAEDTKRFSLFSEMNPVPTWAESRSEREKPVYQKI